MYNVQGNKKESRLCELYSVVTTNKKIMQLTILIITHRCMQLKLL